MAEDKGQKAVVFVTRTSLQFLGSGMGGVSSLTFDPKAIRDIDVVDNKFLTNQIYSFIDQNKLVPSPVIFVFSEQACFYQDLKENDNVKIKSLIQEFVNTVPFDTLLTKAYKSREGARVISINEMLYRQIASAYEAKGFLSLGVIPSFVLGGKMELAPSLDTSLGRYILTNIESLREQSFLSAKIQGEEEDMRATEKQTLEKGFKITRNAIILGVVFLVMIGFLVFLLMR